MSGWANHMMSGWANHIEHIKGTRRAIYQASTRRSQQEITKNGVSPGGPGGGVLLYSWGDPSRCARRRGKARDGGAR